MSISMHCGIGFSVGMIIDLYILLFQNKILLLNQRPERDPNLGLCHPVWAKKGPRGPQRLPPGIPQRDAGWDAGWEPTMPPKGGPKGAGLDLKPFKGHGLDLKPTVWI